MKIVIAPDSFKGSLSAKDVAENIKAGIEIDGTISLEDAMTRGADLLQDAAESVMRLYKLAHQI